MRVVSALQVLINAGQANAATGDKGYDVSLGCAEIIILTQYRFPYYVCSVLSASMVFSMHASQGTPQRISFVRITAHGFVLKPVQDSLSIVSIGLNCRAANEIVDFTHNFSQQQYIYPLPLPLVLLLVQAFSLRMPRNLPEPDSCWAAGLFGFSKGGGRSHGNPNRRCTHRVHWRHRPTHQVRPIYRCSPRNSAEQYCHHVLPSDNRLTLNDQLFYHGIQTPQFTAWTHYHLTAELTACTVPD